MKERLDKAPTPSERPRLSVVIAVRNGFDVIGFQLEALSQQTYTGLFEVIVADNGSTDGTVDLLNSWAARVDWVVVVDASQRRGVSHARNVGAAAASGEYLVFCDADDEVDRGWLAAMARAAESCDIMGGHIDMSRLNPGRESPSLTRAGFPVGLRYLPFPLGGNSAMRASLFHQLEGFDAERFPYGAEEVDLFWRAQLRGHHLCWVPDAVVYVRLRGTARHAARQYYLRGVSSCALAASFRSRGVPQEQVGEIVRAWGSLVTHSPDLFRASRRQHWLGRCAAKCGQVVGSVRYRTLHLAE